MIFVAPDSGDQAVDATGHVALEISAINEVAPGKIH